jgi:hypothetical protein
MPHMQCHAGVTYLRNEHARITLEIVPEVGRHPELDAFMVTIKPLPDSASDSARTHYTSLAFGSRGP